jgi:hypothetical protein
MEDDFKKKMEDDLKKQIEHDLKKIKKSTKINLIGCDTIVKSPSFPSNCMSSENPKKQKLDTNNCAVENI